MMRTGLGLGEPGVVGGRGGPRLLGQTLLVSARAWGVAEGGGGGGRARVLGRTLLVSARFARAWGGLGVGPIW